MYLPAFIISPAKLKLIGVGHTEHMHTELQMEILAKRKSTYTREENINMILKQSRLCGWGMEWIQMASNKVNGGNF
jgi:hypothetical protein